MELKTIICLLLIILLNFTNCQDENNPILKELWKITPNQYFRFFESLHQRIYKYNNATRGLNIPAKMKKLQTLISDEVPFPCDVTNGRSPERPISVHALRPGDIDVIGGMGDSLTAAFGAIAVDIPNVAINNRGVSWSIGGQGTWREFLTIPNILKEYNKKLIGYSLGDSLAWEKPAQFNVAEGGAIVADMPHQAKILRKRMITDSRVNFEKDWKLITLFIGCNDFCGNLCYETESKFMKDHRKNLIETLDSLHDNFPRTLVNLIPAPNLKLLMEFNYRPIECVLTHTVECPCIRGSRFAHLRARAVQLMTRWQEVDMEIANMDRYKDKSDFAIVIQPFTTEVHFPTRRLSNGNNVTDYSYLSADCFHFSQKCDSIAANALWNNMMEPVGNKSRDWDDKLMTRFMCPTDEHPYIYTTGNSPS